MLDKEKIEQIKLNSRRKAEERKQRWRKLEAENKVYEEYIISYLDILGWRHFVETEDCNSLYKKLYRCGLHFMESVDDSEYIHDDASVTLKFSDSLIHLRKVNYIYNGFELRYGTFFSELNSLLLLLVETSSKGLFLRGAVSSGDLFVDIKDNIAFGPAWNRVYKLESEVAKYPRIIIDPNLYQEFICNTKKYSAEHNSPEQEQDYALSMLKKDSDGEMFIDYLQAAINGIVDEGYEESFLQSHYNHIQTFFESKYENSEKSVQKKYDWLKKYHNEFIESNIGGKHLLL